MTLKVVSGKEKDKDAILRELNFLMNKYKNKVKPEHVVEYAKNPDTVLHSKFEWDDEKAGHEYRIWQARQLFRVYVAVIRDDLPACNVFVSLKDDRYGKEDRGGYRPMLEVLEDEELTGQLLDDARHEWNSYKTKYQGLKQLVTAFQTMDEALAVESETMVAVAQ